MKRPTLREDLRLVALVYLAVALALVLGMFAASRAADGPPAACPPGTTYESHDFEATPPTITCTQDTGEDGYSA